MGSLQRSERLALLEESHPSRSIRQQCQLLGVNRSTHYYKHIPVSKEDVHLMNKIREVWMKYAFYGYRRITRTLQSQGHAVNRKRILRLMQQMGLQAIYPRPKTSVKNAQHVIHPYLLGKRAIKQPNEAWMVDITYLKIGSSFMYLVALIDVYSRYVVSWSLSNTLHTEFCLAALDKGLAVGKPQIINSDQGCQFTSDEWVKTLTEAGIQVSMTGVGRCMDNIYIERFWRSLKYEEIYLNDYDSAAELKQAVSNYIEFYNHKRFHQSLGYKTPAEVYFGLSANPVDLWTSPSDQPEPVGPCGQAAGQRVALPTPCPHSLASRPQGPQVQQQ